MVTINELVTIIVTFLLHIQEVLGSNLRELVILTEVVPIFLQSLQGNIFKVPQIFCINFVPVLFN
jgi:hypothetical protein